MVVKKYKLRKEIKEELFELALEALVIISMVGLAYLMFVLNAIMF